MTSCWAKRISLPKALIGVVTSSAGIGALIAARHLSERLRDALRPIEESGLDPHADTLRSQVTQLEKWLIRRALDARGCRRAKPARTPGIARNGLHR